MLKLTGTKELSTSSRKHKREKRLWHDSKAHNLSLGCRKCPDLVACGGLQVELTFYDCLVDNCCKNPENCDSVCRNKPINFAQRVREIGGFQLDNVPPAAWLSALPLPPVVPILYHGKSREVPFVAPAVSLPLYSVIRQHGSRVHDAGATAVATAFCFEIGMPVVLTGVAPDRALERWWNLGRPGRRDEIRRLRDLGVVLATTPNFSLFTDQPRWDDMHSMKRIAITHEEFLQGGVPAALHCNARTERDWERWTEYISSREEVTHVSFEFRTGAGFTGRIDWQTAQLTKLAQNVGRTLHLIVRGTGAGSAILPGLIDAFGEMTVLETTSFLKTLNRQRAVETTSGRIEWETSSTAPGAPVDELLEHNWALVSRSYDPVFGPTTVT